MITKDMIDKLPTVSWSRADYDAHDALNQSGCKLILISAGHYKAYLDAPDYDSPALKMGRLVHLLCLQPELWSSQVVVVPEDAPKKPTAKQREAKKPKPDTVAAIKYWDEFEASAAGKITCDQDEYAEAVRVGSAMKAQADSWGIVPLATELCLTANFMGVPIKAQLDMITADGWIYDYKTSGDYIHPKKVLSDTYKRAYHLQAAFYTLIYSLVFNIKPKGFRMIFGEKKVPNGTGIFEVSPELMAEGNTLLMNAINEYKAAKAFGSYPLYTKQIHKLMPYGSTIAPTDAFYL